MTSESTTTGMSPFQKSKPWWHPRSEQLRGCMLIVQDNARLFLPPGKGKTSTVLKTFKSLKKAGFVDALLVLAPLRVITTSWPQDLEKWADFDDLTYTTIHGGRDGRTAAMKEDVDVYLMNVVRSVRLVAPVMVHQKGGAIVNISTFAAFEPDPVFPTSGVFRAGLASYAKLFADRYAADNVRMNNVLPGFIDSLAEKAEFRERIPMGRYGRAEEVAATISFLVSPGGGYITGQNIRVDGGITRAV